MVDTTIDGTLVTIDDEVAATLHPKLAALRGFWYAKRGSRPLPVRGEIDVTELAPWLGHLVLLQVEDDGRDFFYRVYGTTLAEYFGRDLTGRRVSSLPPDVQRVVRAEYGEAAARAHPCMVMRRRSVNSTRLWMTKLILPLGPGRVDHLLVGVYLAV